MKIRRLYIESTIREGEELTFGHQQSHYLLNVLRLKRASTLRVFNGVDGEWEAQITIADKHSTSAQVTSQLRAPLKCNYCLEIWFAPIKRARTDLIVEKATELGASLIQPVITQRTQTAQVRADRFRKIAIEAAEQTERLDIPEINEAKKLRTALSNINEDQRLYYCDEIAASTSEQENQDTFRTAPFSQELERTGYNPSIILVGPEGGFTLEERKLLRSLKNTIPVALGPRVLRAETAVIAALTLWQAKLGDWNRGVN